MFVFPMYKQSTEGYEVASQLGLTENKAPVKPAKRKKHGAVGLRKAPQAPKRFKSSYICFFTAKRDEVKAELGGTPTVCSDHVCISTRLVCSAYLTSALVLIGGGSLETNGPKVEKYFCTRTCSLGSSSCQGQAEIYGRKVNLHWAVASTLEAYQEGECFSLGVHHYFLSNIQSHESLFRRIQQLPKDLRPPF